MPWGSNLSWAIEQDRAWSAQVDPGHRRRPARRVALRPCESPTPVRRDALREYRLAGGGASWEVR